MFTPHRELMKIRIEKDLPFPKIFSEKCDDDDDPSPQRQTSSIIINNRCLNTMMIGTGSSIPQKTRPIVVVLLLVVVCLGAVLKTCEAFTIRRPPPLLCGRRRCTHETNHHPLSRTVLQILPSFSSSTKSLVGVSQSLVSTDETNHEEEHAANDDDQSRRQPPQPQTASPVTPPPQQSPRTMERLVKYTRYPIWPAWNGVLIWFVGLVLGHQVAAAVEDKLTGRVCPKFFSNDLSSSTTTTTTSPFLLLVHHCHSFAPWDPLRWLQRDIFKFPEGFPAHPHRGFVTLTYFLQGGFSHRDSMGVEQYYGAWEDQGHPTHNNNNNNHTTNPFPHSQWLSTGAGLLHEEMFDVSSSKKQQGWWPPQRHELYQVWINVPAAHKFDAPRSHLLADGRDTPVVHEQEGRVQVRVLAGTYTTEKEEEYTASTPILTPLLVLHVTLEPHTTWTCPLTKELETCVLYLRQGSVWCPSFVLGNEDDDHPQEDLAVTEIPPHSTAFFSSTGQELQLHTQQRAADGLLLAGRPLGEPCVTQGSMVMTTNQEIEQAYADYQRGLFGLPWDSQLSHEEWLDHVRHYPSRYS